MKVKEKERNGEIDTDVKRKRAKAKYTRMLNERKMKGKERGNKHKC